MLSIKMRPTRQVAMCGLMLILAAGACSSAHSEDGPIGALMCRLQASAKVETDARTRAIACVFQPSKGGVQEVYKGTLRFAPVGLLDSTHVLAWTVRGTMGIDVGPGILAQNYESSVTQDAGRPPLIGQDRMSITLRQSKPDAPPVWQMSLRLQKTPA